MGRTLQDRRSHFNGMIHFNRSGGFNVPFCRKPNRFAQAYICNSSTIKISQVTSQLALFEKKIVYDLES